MDRSGLLDEIRPRPCLVYERESYEFRSRYDSLIEIATAICPGFIITDENREIYEETIKYFAADSSCKYSLNKGLFVYGSIGVGKSLYFKIFFTLNRAVTRYGQNNYRILTINDLIDGITEAGPEYWFKSRTTSTGLSDHRRAGVNNPTHLFLDDLGQSSRTAHYYGSTIDVVTAFIQRRYIEYTENYVLTHFSTNLEPDEIRAEYGEFISSRLRQMCTPVRFPGQDKRK